MVFVRNDLWHIHDIFSLPKGNNLGGNINMSLHFFFPIETRFIFVIEKYFTIIKSKTKTNLYYFVAQSNFPATCFQNLYWKVWHQREWNFTSSLSWVRATDTRKCCLHSCVADLASWLLGIGLICKTDSPHGKNMALPSTKVLVSYPLWVVSRTRFHTIHF